MDFLMSDVFEATTKTGQKVVYCVAGAPRGQQAIRELQRACKGGDVVKVATEDPHLLMGSVANPDQVKEF